jgi:flagellar L-ring protein precursor FlgH
VPETAIKQPLAVRPQPVQAVADANGAIYQNATATFLFEDRRARRVGDTLTVNLVERTSASRRSETSESRAASADLSVPTPRVLGVSPNVIGSTAWSPSGALNHGFKDNDSNSNTISGTIAVTVVEVLANGNLVVAGEKQIAVNNDTDYIRLAGVVNPAHISASNTVNSTQLANVQIESKNSQGLERSQLTSMLARFFLTLLPF